MQASAIKAVEEDTNRRTAKCDALLEQILGEDAGVLQQLAAPVRDHLWHADQDHWWLSSDRMCAVWISLHPSAVRLGGRD